MSHQPASLDDSFAGEQNNGALQDFLSDPSTPDLAREVDLHLLRERLGEVLRCLDPRDREVIAIGPLSQSPPDTSRPTNYRVCRGQQLLILHRVKPRK